MPEKTNFKKNRFILTHGVIPWSLGFIVPRSVVRQEQYSGEHVGEQSSERRGLQGQNIPCKDVTQMTHFLPLATTP